MDRSLAVNRNAEGSLMRESKRDWHQHSRKENADEEVPALHQSAGREKPRTPLKRREATRSACQPKSKRTAGVPVLAQKGLHNEEVPPLHQSAGRGRPRIPLKRREATRSACQPQSKGRLAFQDFAQKGLRNEQVPTLHQSPGRGKPRSPVSTLRETAYTCSSAHHVQLQMRQSKT
jgi:hypothetical protein